MLVSNYLILGISIMFRPTKRQRLECPPSCLDIETLQTVPTIPSLVSPPALIRTDLASQLAKELFLERFQKEVVIPFRYSLSSQLQIDTNLEDAMRRRELLKQRIPVGTNACTRVLEAASYEKGPAPILLVVAAEGIKPPTMLLHIPVLARQLRVPLLLLPGEASAEELGKLLGIKRVAILAFLPHINIYREGTPAVEAELHSAVNSFVEFVRTKVPGCEVASNVW